MHGKAIWDSGIDKIAEVSRGIAHEPHKRGFTAPYMKPQL